eukprot:CAMPEP_0183720094 /NCGR_PEP_ID=MMETSP0737-20130205/12806_1 /TAXON_ID=385413 /ORGANISM="Thalassiosira miniscula, Strain CCMP1093" /LENGTH=674 /DNA_ID=CAMNT_0025949905 /DNA_START=270 /DNA_END=2291 /DNA_ORIENTATION=+
MADEVDEQYTSEVDEQSIDDDDVDEDEEQSIDNDDELSDDQSINQANELSDDQSINETDGQSVNESDEQSINEDDEKSIDEVDEQSQSIEQDEQNAPKHAHYSIQTERKSSRCAGESLPPDDPGEINSFVRSYRNEYKQAPILQSGRKEKKSLEKKTLRDHRNRIAHIYKWWEVHYKEYFENGTRLLTEDEKEDTEKLYHNNTRDIIYSRLDVQMVKAFLSSKKKSRIKADGTVALLSACTITKYDEAIKWGSRCAGEPLPPDYHGEINSFLRSYRYEYKQAQIDAQHQIINAGTEIAPEHRKDILETERKSGTIGIEKKRTGKKTMQEYRNRIAQIYKWWELHYEEYYENGTRPLSKKEKDDEEKFHHNNTRDIIYSGLNVRMVKAFLSSKKKKRIEADGTVTLTSFSTIKKYNEAIKWGSRQAEQDLPPGYHTEMSAFLQSYNEEVRQAQKEDCPVSSKKEPEPAQKECHTDEQVPMASSIPLSSWEIPDLHTETKEAIGTFKNDVGEAISKVVNAKLASKEEVNILVLKNFLNDMKRDIIQKLECITVVNNDDVPMDWLAPVPEPTVTVLNAGPFQFTYQGKVWCVPESFQFPAKINRLDGWRRWLQGAIHFDGTKKWWIKPYRKLCHSDLHSAQLKNAFTTEWKPIFTKMMEAPGLEIPTELKDIDEAFV